MSELDSHRRHQIAPRQRKPRRLGLKAPVDGPAGVMLALDAAYPRANLPGSWWLGNGLIEVRACRGRLLLEGFWVSPNRRRMGHGAAMLDLVCGLADRFGAEIDTWADRYDKAHEGLYNGELRAWYARWGFAPHPTRKGWLRRIPRESC